MKKIFFKSYLSHETEADINRTNFIQKRIKIVEKYIPELAKAIFEYISKNAKSRDSGDKVATVLDKYAKAENVTPAIKLQLRDFANILLEVGTCRDAQVQAMEMNVLEQLNEHEKLCKLVQSGLKSFIIAHDKQRTWHQQLKRMKESQLDEQQVSLAEAEFLKARGESFRSSKNLEEQIDVFERKRLNSIRESLLAWTIAELQFHTKAVQLFTDAYRIAADIDVNADIEEFRNKLKLTETSPPSETMHRSESILQMISYPFQQKNFAGSGIPHPSSLPSTISTSESSESS